MRWAVRHNMTAVVGGWIKLRGSVKTIGPSAKTAIRMTRIRRTRGQLKRRKSQETEGSGIVAVYDAPTREVCRTWGTLYHHSAVPLRGEHAEPNADANDWLVAPDGGRGGVSGCRRIARVGTAARPARHRSAAVRFDAPRTWET